MSLLLFSSLLPAARCLAFFAAFCGSLPCLFCGGSRPCPFWNFLLPAPCLFLRPFSGAFHVGCPSLFFPPSRAFRGGKGGGGRISGSVAAASLRRLPSFFSLLANLPGRKRDVAAGLADALPLLPFVACSPLGCPVAFVPLERSCRSGKKRKLRCHYYPSPFGCLRPVGKVGKTEGGVTAFSRRFPLRRLLLRRHRLRASQGGKNRCGERGSEVFPLLPFAASPPSSPFRRTFPGGKGVLRRGSCAVAGPVCCRQRALLFSAAACCRSSLQQS